MLKFTEKHTIWGPKRQNFIGGKPPNPPDCRGNSTFTHPPPPHHCTLSCAVLCAPHSATATMSGASAKWALDTPDTWVTRPKNFHQVTGNNNIFSPPVHMGSYASLSVCPSVTGPKFTVNSLDQKSLDQNSSHRSRSWPKSRAPWPRWVGHGPCGRPFVSAPDHWQVGSHQPQVAFFL